MQIIFIDYIDGAGGEFVSYALSKHPEFYQPNIDETQTLRVSHQNDITGFLLASRYKNFTRWDDVAEIYMHQLKDRLSNIESPYVAIPYHSCYHDHNTALKRIFPGCKIIYIDPIDNHRLIATEILRKVHLIKLNIQQIKYVHQSIVKLDNIKINLNDFWGLDIILLRNDIPPDNQSRQHLVNQILNKTFHTQQTSDYIIPWQDLFLDMAKIPLIYHDLCAFLGIDPREEVLTSIQERNKKNLDALMDFDVDRFIDENFAL